MAFSTQALDASWRPTLGAEFSKPYMTELAAFLQAEQAAGKLVLPVAQELFTAFRETSLSDVKVVILGQDPYHGEGQAHGLSFSVKPGVAIPPSLRNMFKELDAELNLPPATQGCLLPWAQQGVLLLNSVLSVEAGNANSHQGRGWEQFTDRAIEVVNTHCSNVVFLLWGAYAQRKGSIIDTDKHCVLSAPHPSPLSAYRGFFGCGHFNATNAYLERAGRVAIDWAIAQE